MNCTCQYCYWFQPYAKDRPEQGGECMVNPPVAAVVRDQVVSLRPHVQASERCDKWSGLPGIYRSNEN